MFRSRAPSPRRRVLIVNAYVDQHQRSLKRRTAVLKALAPVYLAGAFELARCDLFLHDEHTQGPVAERALEETDMLVLTGMTSAYDRMRQLCAYAKSSSPAVCVVAGGAAVRSFPNHARAYFDYACQGDIEELRDVVAEALGPSFVSERMSPRYELAPWLRGRFHYVESSRNCNFRCSFCALTAEGHRYQRYPLDDLEAQIRAGGDKDFLVLIDNNFYGNDRQAFSERLSLLDRMRDEGRFRAWGGLVTNDFFLDDENVERAARSGCEALFCGIESFDRASLERFRKFQNTKLSQVETIRRSLDAGILFIYGLMFDVTARDTRDMEEEVDFILSNADLPMPAFFAFPIPYPRTPLFRESLRSGALQPLIRAEDLDGSKLSLRPLDAQSRVLGFMNDLLEMRGYRARLLRHEAAFLRRHRDRLSPAQLAVMLARSGSLAVAKPREGALAQFRGLRALFPEARRPARWLESRFESHFRPTLITDERGAIHPMVAEDLESPAEVAGGLRVIS